MPSHARRRLTAVGSAFKFGIPAPASCLARFEAGASKRVGALRRDLRIARFSNPASRGAEMIVEKPLGRSVRRRFAFAASGAVLSLACLPALAAVVDSGTVNIPIADTIDGVYLNLVTGTSGGTGGAVPGWDINPYSATGTATNFNLWGATTTTWLNTTGNASTSSGYLLAPGTSIGSGGSYFRPGGSTNIASAVTLNSDQNFFGVQFTNENTAATNYGWIQIQFGANVGTRAIVRYVYENTGQPITVGTTPVTLQEFSVD